MISSDQMILKTLAQMAELTREEGDGTARLSFVIRKEPSIGYVRVIEIIGNANNYSKRIFLPIDPMAALDGISDEMADILERVLVEMFVFFQSEKIHEESI